MTYKWLHLHKESISTIRDVASSLTHLANGFKIVGNGLVSAELYDMAEDLDNAAIKASQAWRGKLNESYKSSTNAIGTILSTLLLSADHTGKKGT